ncbi:hypothetical protein GCM10009530_64170 [Microbispora corallina]|uniref:Uncharacterized protein n=1 Tax=Microbispora corallina TaxID=83302 RepID=A0ABQ4GCN8_9ACTN|nr:hypothetical protein Mco01_77810 [Microbispora corallina]
MPRKKRHNTEKGSIPPPTPQPSPPTPETTPPPISGERPLVGQRFTLIWVVAFLVGLVVGFLTYKGLDNIYLAILAGAAACGNASAQLHKLIE